MGTGMVKNIMVQLKNHSITADLNPLHSVGSPCKLPICSALLTKYHSFEFCVATFLDHFQMLLLLINPKVSELSGLIDVRTGFSSIWALLSGVMASLLTF